jgi:branched-chain amino acid aminotransferase
MIYLNDRLIPPEEAVISVFDHGFLYGDGIYETMRVYRGRVFRIKDHIERLFRSAEMISLDIGKGAEEIEHAVKQTIKANRLVEAVVRITVSRGAGPTGLDPALCSKPTFVIIAQSFRGYPHEYHERGIRIVITKIQRNCKKALDPRIKSLNFLNNILAKIEAKNKGAFEGIMLNHSGYLTEGTVSNIFFVKKDTLCTPSIASGILDGITRRLVLEIASEAGIPTRQSRFRKEDLYSADEVFLSNTTMEVMPVAEVDDITVPASPGRITRLLQRKFRDRVGSNELRI